MVTDSKESSKLRQAYCMTGSIAAEHIQTQDWKCQSVTLFESFRYPHAYKETAESQHLFDAAICENFTTHSHTTKSAIFFKFLQQALGLEGKVRLLKRGRSTT